MNAIIKLRIALWLVLAAAVGWLFYMAVAPSGKITYVYNFEKDNYFISKLTPNERVEPIAAGGQVIVGNPVYFTLRTPRRFDKAKVSLKYKSELPIIETGILADKTIWRYRLRPIENKTIDRLSREWETISADGVILLQQEKKFNSIDDFLNNLPNSSEVALYNYDLRKEFLLDGYTATATPAGVDFALRGPYQFYTYIKGEDLDFQFSFTDINKNKDSDPVNLHLYYNDQLIDTRNLPDDGITSDSGQTNGERELEFKLVNLPEGVYKIEARANDDIITNSIVTKQSKLSFINKIWIADNGDENITLYSDSRIINAQTTNPGRLQSIQAGEKELAVKETYKQFSIGTEEELSEIKLPKDDMILSGDGVFSFSKESLINPRFRRVDNNFDPAVAGVNYILAKYKIPALEGGWRIAGAEFDLNKNYQEDGKHSFIISIPGLKADDDIDDAIEIGEIRIDLEGISLFEKLKGYFN